MENKKWIFYILFVCFWVVKVQAQNSYEAGTVDLLLSEKENSIFATGFSGFSVDNHFVWCGSAIRAVEDGKYYLFYSAMDAGSQYPAFGEAWLLGSKIGIAVSDSPY